MVSKDALAFDTTNRKVIANREKVGWNPLISTHLKLIYNYSHSFLSFFFGIFMPKNIILNSKFDNNMLPIISLIQFLLQKKLKKRSWNSAERLWYYYKELRFYMQHCVFYKISFTLCCFCFSILLSFAAFLLIME